MYYSIERTLEIFPYVCFFLLGVTLLFLEIKNIKEMVADRLDPNPGRGGFIPPSEEGYEYYVSNTTIVYILQKAKNRFRVYMILGDSPGVHMRHDKYGKYFTVHCKDTGTAEKIIDKTFNTADRQKRQVGEI